MYLGLETKVRSLLRNTTRPEKGRVMLRRNAMSFKSLLMGVFIALCMATCADAVIDKSDDNGWGGNNNTDNGSNGFEDGGADLDTDTDVDSDTFPDGDADTDVDSDTDADSDSDMDTDADSDTDTDTDGDSDSDMDADTDGDTDTDSDTDTDTGSHIEPDGGCAEAIGAFSFDFDTPDQCALWNTGTLVGTDCTAESSWQCGAVDTSLWPNQAGSGAQCIGILDQFYHNKECSYMSSPSVDISPCAGTVVYLVFDLAHSYQKLGGTCADGLVVQIDTGGGVWEAVTPSPGYTSTLDNPKNLPAGQSAFCGSQQPWNRYSWEIGESYKTVDFRVRFYMESDSGGAAYGAFVDDLSLSATAP